MNITGKIVEIGSIVAVNEKFKKREFVIEYAKNPKYPQILQFDLNQDKVDILDGMNEGDEVSVEFDVGGRKWVNPSGASRYFNKLLAFKVTATGKTTQISTPNLACNGGGVTQPEANDNLQF